MKGRCTVSKNQNCFKLTNFSNFRALVFQFCTFIFAIAPSAHSYLRGLPAVPRFGIERKIREHAQINYAQIIITLQIMIAPPKPKRVKGKNQYCLRCWEREREHKPRRLECRKSTRASFIASGSSNYGGEEEALVATQLSRALIAHSTHSKVSAGPASPTAQNLSKYVSGQCATAWLLSKLPREPKKNI